MITHETDIAPERAILDALKLALQADASRAGVALLVNLFDSEPGVLTNWRRLRTTALAIAAKVDYATALTQFRKLINAGILDERKARSGRGREVRLNLPHAHEQRTQQMQQVQQAQPIRPKGQLIHAVRD